MDLFGIFGRSSPAARAQLLTWVENFGEECPEEANKVNVQADVSATGTFTSGKNGPITACLTVDPPDTTLTCPAGQELVLISVSYTNVSVSAPGVGSCDPTPATFSANFFPSCP